MAVPLLRRAGLSEDFDGRQQRISAASQGKFLEYAAEAMDDSAFGLHLAKKANPRDAGLVFYVAAAAKNVGEAVALFARYSRIANEAARFKPMRGLEGIVAEIDFVGLSRHTARHVIEFGVALTIKGLREIAGRNIRPKVVGSDRYDAAVGSSPAGITFSEWALSNPSAWAYLAPIVIENDG
jgi:hypothetical protein